MRSCAAIAIPLALVIALVTRSAAGEALHFERLGCDLTPSDTAPAGIATFPFVNVSPVAVTILLLRPSCSCVRPHVEKTTFLPGERGEVVVDALYGAMTGLQRRRIEVVSDHPDSRSTVIEVVMHLPSGPQFTPVIARWSVGEPPGTKAVVVGIPADFHHRLVTATAARPEVTPVLVAAGDGGPPRLDVTVSDTARPFTASILVTADTGKVYTVFAQVGGAAAGGQPGVAGDHGH